MDKRRRPAPTYRPGQWVWLSAKELPLRGYTRKLTPLYVGPFKILHRINPVSYRLALPPSLHVHPTFHISRLWPVLCLVGPSDPPGPRMVDGALVYTVKRFLDVWWVRGVVQYLVDWEGYRPEERSWVPSHHILDCDIILALRQACAAGLGTSGAAPSGGGGYSLSQNPDQSVQKKNKGPIEASHQAMSTLPNEKYDNSEHSLLAVRLQITDSTRGVQLKKKEKTMLKPSFAISETLDVGIC
ncbi:hypothetical protein P4O66_003857 [Electrophorus voltai]|uniref:Chromo domain-containing protein n=1 Tax=Electrophorus voltai TaxID=2609070 RepID=A0AAD8ZRM8_9TELE|nr:hypothetical protein P4O66_003857 [Electrophorus voltai]